MAISDEITRLQTAKNDIKTAIENKGVIVGDGTLDTYASKIDGIKTGVKLESKGVDFIDYDGTLLYTYTIAEAQNLTELPPLPEHDGLICQEWNWNLNDIKDFNNELIVGATYTTDDGSTRIYITLYNEWKSPILSFTQSKVSAVEIDWGDGNTEISPDSTGLCSIKHNYATAGDYVIKLKPLDNSVNINFGPMSGTNRCVVLNDGKDETWNTNLAYSSAITKVEIGSNFPYMCPYAFYKCFNLRTITLPNTFGGFHNQTANASYSLNQCSNLKCIVIPNAKYNNNFVIDHALDNCYQLEYISFPNFSPRITTSSFSNLYSLRKITGNGICPYQGYPNCYSLQKVIAKNSFPSNALFQNGYSLRRAEFYNDYASSVNNSTASFCSYGYSLEYLKMPKNVTGLTGYLVSNVHNSFKVLDFSDSLVIPTLDNTSITKEEKVFQNLQIVVPDNLYDDWIVATNWTNYAEHIVKASEVEL